MPAAARLNDSVAGTTAGEHCGHVPPHGPLGMAGAISGACSATVRIDGIAAAVAGSVTTEGDACCGTGVGTVAAGSGTVRIGGRPAARLGDALAPHDGTGRISSGSPSVRIGG